MRMSLSDFGFVNRFLFGRKILKKSVFGTKISKNIKNYQKKKQMQIYQRLSLYMQIYQKMSKYIKKKKKKSQKNKFALFK